MAGFDFEFTYSEAQEPIVRVCQAAARARAKRLGISWRWRTLADRHILVTVDGNSRRTDLLGYRLERDLPLVAEGCEGAGLSPSKRARLGRGFADLMLRGRDIDQEDPMPLREVADTRYYYPPYEYECPQAPRLHARLSITSELLVGWNFGEVAAEVLLEELHTACELVLEELVNRRSKKLSFSELVTAADSAELLQDYPDEPSPTVLLTELKDTRKNVRHRAAEGAETWVKDHWEDCAMLIERLVDRVNSMSS